MIREPKIIRLNLKTAKILLSCFPDNVVYLREVKSLSGKYRVLFGFVFAPDKVVYYTTGYLTSKNSYRFMCSL